MFAFKGQKPIAEAVFGEEAVRRRYLGPRASRLKGNVRMGKKDGFVHLA